MDSKDLETLRQILETLRDNTGFLMMRDSITGEDGIAYYLFPSQSLSIALDKSTEAVKKLTELVVKYGKR